MKNEKLWNKFNGILSTISIDTYNTVTELANADDDPKVISKRADSKSSIISSFTKEGMQAYNISPKQVRDLTDDEVKVIMDAKAEKKRKREEKKKGYRENKEPHKKTKN